MSLGCFFPLTLLSSFWPLFQVPGSGPSHLQIPILLGPSLEEECLFLAIPLQVQKRSWLDSLVHFGCRESAMMVGWRGPLPSPVSVGEGNQGLCLARPGHMLFWSQEPHWDQEVWMLGRDSFPEKFSTFEEEKAYHAVRLGFAEVTSNTQISVGDCRQL